MLQYNEIRQRKIIKFEGQPYEVVDSHVFRKQQRKPVNQTKLKNLLTGKVVEYSFHQSEKAEEAELSNRSIKYLYEKRGEYWFCDPENPADRFFLPQSIVENTIKYVRPNDVVTAQIYEDDIIAISVPIKVQLTVKEAPPSVKGNTAQGGDKLVTLETGARITTPLFVQEGDVIEINTETGEYVTRVEKK